MKFSHELKFRKKNINVLILCGGYGSRISNITKKVPKPLIKIFNIPFLYYLIKNLTRYNFYNFYLLTHYKNNNFLSFKKKYEKNIGGSIKIIQEKIKLDTGGSVINAIKKINNENDFLLINGDTFLDVDYEDLYNDFKKKNSLLMFLIKSLKDSKKLNSMNIDKNGKIYFSKTKLMNSGVYFFKKENLKKFLNLKICSFENLILKKKISSNEIRGIKINNKFIDIGSYSSLKKLKKFIQKNYFQQKILFLDRDNTLIYDKGYTYKIKDLKLIKKNIYYIKNKFKNYLKIIVTNQSGIGRGYYKENHFKLFMSKLTTKLKRYDINISKIYFCPHHKNANIKNYKKNCSYRKPKDKMVTSALKKLDIIKRNNIILVGNDDNDRILAKNSKIKYLDQRKIN